MYTRNFDTREHSVKQQNIPVQSFEDSFSADAFIKSEQKARSQYVKEENTNNTENNLSENDDGFLKKSISAEELLIVGLVVLLLGERDKKENELLPILLSLLLL